METYHPEMQVEIGGTIVKKVFASSGIRISSSNLMIVKSVILM